MAFGLGAALAGCAVDDRSNEPSFVGLSTLAVADDQSLGGAKAQGNPINPALRYVKTNKLLGAMALQKVTGASIAPERLSDPD